MSSESYGRGESVIQSLYNICLAGKFGVGKTTIFKQVINKNQASAAGVAEHTYTVSGFPAKIKLHDTGGIERHSLSMGNYYRQCHCVVFVYDITDSESFHYLKKEYDFIMEKGYCDTDTKFVILRNKIDVPKSQIMVSKEFEMEYVRNNFGNSISCVVETAGEKNIGIQEFFQKNLIQILQAVDPVEYNRDIFKGYYAERNTVPAVCCN